MRVSDICSREVSHVGRATSVLDAARRMRQEHVGDLVVVEEQRGRLMPVAVLTDRDVVIGILARDGEHVRTLDVGDVIEEGTLVTAREDEDVRPVLHRMRTFSVRRVPVVDHEGALTGVLSIDDVIAALSDDIAEVAALVSQQAAREPAHRP